MNRPEVTVVMPFAGDRSGARDAIAALRTLAIDPGDELILVDNSGTVAEARLDTAGVRIVPAAGERSPAHARNVGAAHARNEWILFLDADTRPAERLLDAYFAEPVDQRVGALAGEVLAAPGGSTLAGRYGAARSFLGQEAHLAHPYRPRAAAANLLVRRSAFAEVGGFYEGVRAAEDTDFSWRLQEAGWSLEARSHASVEHRYRPTISELRRQWRGYAAGRAWLARRYDGFDPQPALVRALRRARARVAARAGRARAPVAPRGAPRLDAGRLERGSYLALDALLSLEELAGFALSNRPPGDRDRRGVDAVLIADRFPGQGDPLVELAGTLERVRVEALARPRSLDAEAARRLRIDYLEDDGTAARLAASAALMLRHPVRCVLDLARRGRGAPPLRRLAPAVLRLERDPGARIQPLGGAGSRTTAERLARLAGRPLERS